MLNQVTWDAVVFPMGHENTLYYETRQVAADSLDWARVHEEKQILTLSVPLDLKKEKHSENIDTPRLWLLTLVCDLYLMKI